MMDSFIRVVASTFGRFRGGERSRVMTIIVEGWKRLYETWPAGCDALDAERAELWCDVVCGFLRKGAGSPLSFFEADGLNVLFTTMRAHTSSAAVLSAACNLFVVVSATTMEKPVGMDETVEGVPLVVEAMDAHGESVEEEACRFLAILTMARGYSVHPALVTCGVLPHVNRVLRTSRNKTTVEDACSVVTTMVRHRTMHAILPMLELADSMLTALEMGRELRWTLVVSNALTALGCLAKAPGIGAAIVSAGGLDTIGKTMDKFPGEKVVRAGAGWALYCIASQPENRAAMAESGAGRRLERAMVKNQADIVFDRMFAHKSVNLPKGRGCWGW